MSYIRNGYVVRSTSRKRGRNPKNYRDWWFVPAKSLNTGSVSINHISLPAQYIGKKIRLKVEVVEDPQPEEEV